MARRHRVAQQRRRIIPTPRRPRSSPGQSGARSSGPRQGPMIGSVTYQTVESGGRPLTILHPLNHRSRPDASWRSSPLGQRQIHLLDWLRASMRRTARSDRRYRHHPTRRGRAGEAARARSLRLPVLPPRALADGVRKHPRADGDRKAARRRGARTTAPGNGAVGSRPSLPSPVSGEQQRIANRPAPRQRSANRACDEPTGNLDSRPTHIMNCC